MAYYTMREKDGSEWGYNPVTDKAEYYHREDRESSYGDYSYSQEYNKLKSELGGYSSISPEDEYRNDFSRRINQIKDSRKRQELMSEYQSKCSRYNRESEQSQQEYREKRTQKKEEAIAHYKREWKNKNALWRVFHQKYNPKNQNFNYKTAGAIENEIRNNFRR